MLKQMCSYPKLERSQARDLWMINAYTYSTHEKNKNKTCALHLTRAFYFYNNVETMSSPEH